MPKPLRLLTGRTGPYPQIGIHVPPELMEALKNAAQANDRSLAQECIRRLRISFEQEHPPTSAPNVTTISKYANRKE